MNGKPWILAAVLFVLGAAVAPRAAESHLMRYADIHGDSIVFTYEGDLWMASATTGETKRLTSDPGREFFAKFSPDGSLLAFTGNYDGGTDVYVMDARGGVPRRLTYHPARDYVLGWFPDGKRILFRSRREYPFRGEEIYSISVKGGLEKKLPVDRAGLTALSPDGTMIAYNRISRESRTWKRHEGGDAQDIWMGSLAKGDFHKITSWKGTDNFPMWQGDTLYFTSDREAGTLNIFAYTISKGTARALTHYTDHDVEYPSIGPGAIVYQYDQRLYVLDLSTGASRKVPVEIRSDRVHVRPRFVDPAAHTGAFGLSPDGSKFLLTSRGEVLVVPVKKDEGPPINLTRTSGSREKEAVWSPDGKWVAFLSDATGEEEVYLADAKGEGSWKRLTHNGRGYRMHLVWSPDSKYLLFGDVAMRLNLLDVATGKTKVIDQSEYDDGWDRWGIQDFVWSPDSKWIAYTKKMANTNEVILLYSMENGTVTPVTDDASESWSPSFDPGGRYLYFLSNRSYRPIMGTVDQDHVFLNMALPYVVILKKGRPSPFAPGLAGAEEQDPAPSGKDAKKGASSSTIDLGDFARRTVPAKGVKPGNYFRLEAKKGGFTYLAKTKPEFLKYQVVTDETTTRQTLYSYSLKKKKAVKLLDGVNNYHLSADGKKTVVKRGKSFSIVKGKPISLAEAKFTIDPLQEFAQIFNEAWRVERDWYYDPKMQGVDWTKVGDHYRTFLPDCGDRSDLNFLIGEMIAELNTGHTYVYGGDHRRSGSRVRTGLLGCAFEAPEGSRFYRFGHVIPGKPWDASLRSPLAAPGCPIGEGDYLVAIDGRTVDTAHNPYAYLVNKAGKVVTLTYNDRPSEEGAKSYRLRTLPSEYAIRYEEWVDSRRAYVDRLSNGTIGYIHLPNMMEQGLITFAKGFYPQLEKKAILLDARYNGGGFVSGMIIDRLERKVWSVTQPREGKRCTNPEAAFFGPYALLINEDTGSDGEMFSEAIKIGKLAKIFGMRTWGGAFGIEPHETLVDGGIVTPPQYGLYGLKGKWLIEGHGVDPDVEVQNMPGDVLRGRDAQLERAVTYLLDQGKAHPRSLPDPPAYPDKARPAGSDQM